MNYLMTAKMTETVKENVGEFTWKCRLKLSDLCSFTTERLR